jgi:hypothetical protein
MTQKAMFLQSENLQLFMKVKILIKGYKIDTMTSELAGFDGVLALQLQLNMAPVYFHILHSD